MASGKTNEAEAVHGHQRRDEGLGLNVKSLYEIAKSGTGDQLKAELKRQDVTCPIDDIRLSGTCEQVCVGEVSGKNKDKTLLHIACSHGNASTAKALLELGASPLERTAKVYVTSRLVHVHGRETCFHLAAEAGSGDVINVLRMHGNLSVSCLREVVNRRSKLERTALEDLAFRHTSRCQNEKGEYTTRLLDKASVQASRSSPGKALIAAGADIATPCRYFEYFAMYFSNTVCAVTVFDENWLRQIHNPSALHLAIYTNDHDLVRDLVCTGAPLENRLEHHENHTPLHLAVQFLQVDLVKLLVEAGADVNSQLDMVITRRLAPVYRILRLPTDTRGIVHVSPIHLVFAVATRQLCIRPHLIPSNGKPCLLDHEREVLSVVKRARTEIVEILLRAGATAFGKFTPRKSSGPLKASEIAGLWKNDADLEPSVEFMQRFAEENLDSGGPEVLELLAKVKGRPQSLKSYCRLAVRSHLTPPILLEGNIDRLPLPYQVKRYVAMDTM